MTIESVQEVNDGAGFRKEYGTGMCVIMALDSMLSQVAGYPIAIDPRFTTLRQSKLAATYNLDSRHPIDAISAIYGVRADSPEGKIRWVKIRHDKMWIANLVKKISDGNDAAGATLRDSQVRYARGRLTDASSFVDQGVAVGVVSATSELNGSSAHIFHLGKIGGQLVDMSSNNQPKILTEHEIDYHSRETARVVEYTRSWNLILISKKLP